MSEYEEQISSGRARVTSSGKQPLVRRLSGNEFEREVLEKLARLETKMDMLVGGAQPGRMKLAEDRLATLEKNDARRAAYDRVMSAVIAFVVSAVIAMHDKIFR
jgi:hypothetical protein